MAIVVCALSLIYILRFNFNISGAIDEALFDYNSSITDMRDALEKGAQVDARNSEGMTPLMLAARRGDVPRAQFLIANGADVNARNPKLNNWSVLQFAINYGDDTGSLDIARLSINNGANVRVRGRDNDSVLHNALNITNFDTRMLFVSYLIKLGAPVNAQDNKGDTMLHRAVQIKARGWIDMFRKQYFLLTDEQLKNKSGYTPLTFAENFGFTEIVEILEKKPSIIGMDVKVPVNEYGPNGLTILMMAVLAGKKDLVQELLADRKANINLRSSDVLQFTPLQLAMLQEDVPMVALLLKNGADMSVQNADGQNAITFIDWVYSVPIKKQLLQLFVQSGGQINVQDAQGNTLLHYVTMHNDLELAKFMVKTYGKMLLPGIKNRNYDTPMDIAYRNRNTAMMNLLVKIGASPPAAVKKTGKKLAK